MAGYMNTQYGNIYEGKYRLGGNKPVANGRILVLDKATKKMVLPEADKDFKITCTEKVPLYDGLVGYDFMVDEIPAGKIYYLNETPFDGSTSAEYNTATWEVPVGHFIKAHPLLVGEHFTADTVNTVDEMTQYSLKADGMVG